MRLNDLKAPQGANKKCKRVGRGESSGHGKTAGRGGKGQSARTGKGKPRRGFEGGQMPMYRRMPKRGFVNAFAKPVIEVNVDTLAGRFTAGATVDLETLRSMGLAPTRALGLRVLGRGEITHALTVKADHFSASAKQKIEAAGGKAVDLMPAKEAAPAPQPTA
ncbi:MAG: 50S ribosomal protein L15 [Deltaproteobacteria bacterium]|nr:50S ribosomal protein L15 [Deltaproteobacteria bacterium]